MGGRGAAAVGGEVVGLGGVCVAGGVLRRGSLLLRSMRARRARISRAIFLSLREFLWCLVSVWSQLEGESVDEWGLGRPCAPSPWAA